ncbi:MAG: 50S ribosomal protein L29 [Bacteroidales bacterium]|nr:50S ribosomal protein L29 [Bacteroidales bacterium]
MKQQVIRELSSDELHERLEEELKRFNKLKLNHAVSPLENPNQLKEARKDIARMKTEVRKRQFEEHQSNNK